MTHPASFHDGHDNVASAVVEVVKRRMGHIWDHFWMLGYDDFVEVHVAFMTREDREAMDVELYYVGPKREQPEFRKIAWCLVHDTPGMAGDMGDCWGRGADFEECKYEDLLLQVPKRLEDA